MSCIHPVEMSSRGGRALVGDPFSGWRCALAWTDHSSRRQRRPPSVPLFVDVALPSSGVAVLHPGEIFFTVIQKKHGRSRRLIQQTDDGTGLTHKIAKVDSLCYNHFHHWREHTLTSFRNRLASSLLPRATKSGRIPNGIVEGIDDNHRLIW